MSSPEKFLTCCVSILIHREEPVLANALENEVEVVPPEGAALDLNHDMVCDAETEMDGQVSIPVRCVGKEPCVCVCG